MSAAILARWTVAEELAAHTLRDVTAALYTSPDYTSGDRCVRTFELVEMWAAIELARLTPGDVDTVLADASDPVRLADCRVAAWDILAAQ